MEKIDLFKQHKSEYTAETHPSLARIGPVQYLAIEGRGAPGGDAFQQRVGALYGMAFTIKMTRKFTGKGDYVVSKLEAQWWVGDEAAMQWVDAPRDEWRWRLMIRTPNVVGTKDRITALEALKKRGKGEFAGEVELRPLEESLCVQMLHVGPYENECDTIAQMEAFIGNENLQRCGLYHDIYLNDPRRIPPERLKTIVRWPVRKTH